MHDTAQPPKASPLSAIILAAGQGTRMKSARPKVMHELCGRPMVEHVIRAALEAGAEDVVLVVGFGRAEVEAHVQRTFPGRVRIAVQEEQRGTGHAVQCALPSLRPETERVMILCGDTPLLQAKDLVKLREALRGENTLALLSFEASNPSGYGRVLRDDRGLVLCVREEKDCSASERAVREVNAGVYVVRASFLKEALRDLRPNNAQGELYLTDVVEAAAKNLEATTAKASDPSTLLGVNDRTQLAVAEEALYQRTADRLRRGGATIRSSARIDAGVEVEADATIEHGVVLRGTTRIGAGAVVDVGCVLTDVQVAAGALLKPYTVASLSSVGESAQIGPFAHLRADSEIHREAHVGNFVETKKTVLREGAKANHLAYLGDGEIGAGANIGAGTIFCNYDGFQKHRTEIGAGAFIGSDSQLVAPVRVGEGAYVATGTTVTSDVPPAALAIARVRQENKEDYATRLKARLQAAKEAARKPG